MRLKIEQARIFRQLWQPERASAWWRRCSCASASLRGTFVSRARSPRRSSRATLRILVCDSSRARSRLRSERLHGRGHEPHELPVQHDQRRAHRHPQICQFRRKAGELLRHPEQLAIKRGLVSKVVVNGCHIDPGQAADFPRRGAVIALRRKNLDRRVQQSLLGIVMFQGDHRTHGSATCSV